MFKAFIFLLTFFFYFTQVHSFSSFVSLKIHVFINIIRVDFCYGIAMHFAVFVCCWYKVCNVRIYIKCKLKFFFYSFLYLFIWSSLRWCQGCKDRIKFEYRLLKRNTSKVTSLTNKKRSNKATQEKSKTIQLSAIISHINVK